MTMLAKPKGLLPGAVVAVFATTPVAIAQRLEQFKFDLSH